MKIENVRKAELKSQFYEETKKYILLTVYIAMILGGLKMYKRMILTEYHVSYFSYGFGLFESMMQSVLGSRKTDLRQEPPRTLLLKTPLSRSRT